MLPVFALFGVVGIEILVTYSRLPLSELYHVSGSGIELGAGRALVYLDYPVALAAIATLAFVADRSFRPAALLALVLCAAVFWPGVVKQSDLDARPVNAIAAVGVALAFVLALTARGRPAQNSFHNDGSSTGCDGRCEARTQGAPIAALSARLRTTPSHRSARPGGSALHCETSFKPDRRGDRLRVVVAAILLAAALPWLGADLGFSYDGVPVLGSIFQTGALRSQPHVPGLHPAVHHGHHHGMDGVLLALTALYLSRRLAGMRSPRLRPLTAAYLSLMLAYGVANAANDFFLEQVVKRGWTDWEIPDVTQPKATAAWAVIVLAAALLYLGPFRRLRR